MNAQESNSTIASTKTSVAISAKLPIITCRLPKSWLWFPAAGLVLGAAGVAAMLGFHLAESGVEGITTQVGGKRSGEVVQQPAALENAAGHSLPATTHSTHENNDDAGRVVVHAASLEALIQNLAVATTPEDLRAAADALIALGTEEALSAWGQALMRETDPAKRKAMMEALDNLNGEAAVEMITQLLQLSEAPEVLDGVARTLGRMANPETVKYLADIHASATVGSSPQERSLRILGAIANPAAVPGLIQVAHQPAYGTDITGQAFLSLGKIGNPASLTALASAFDTLSPDYFAQRQQALASISSVRNVESRTMLADLAANSHQPLVADAAAQALANLPPTTNEEAAQPSAELPSPHELLAKTRQLK